MKRTAVAATANALLSGSHATTVHKDPIAYGIIPWDTTEHMTQIEKTFTTRVMNGLPKETLDPQGLLGLRWYCKSDLACNQPKSKPSPPKRESIGETPKTKKKRKHRTNDYYLNKKPKTVTLKDLYAPDTQISSSLSSSSSSSYSNEEKENEGEVIADVCDGDTEEMDKRFIPGLKKSVRYLCKQCGPGFRIIARQIGVAGSREFAIVWPLDFLNRMSRAAFCPDRVFNENIPEEIPCRLHLDLDIKVKYSTTENAHNITERQAWGAWKHCVDRVHEFLKRFMIRLVKTLNKCYCLNEEYTATEAKFIVTDSSHRDKVSKHVTLVLGEDSLLFKNRTQIGFFVKHAADEWKKEIQLQNVPWYAKDEVESKRAKKEAVNRRMEDMAASTGPTTRKDGNTSPPLEPLQQCSSSVGSELDLIGGPQSLTTMDQSEIDLICLNYLDYGIYNGEREFRTLESTKCGEKRPLVLDFIYKVDLRDVGTPICQKYLLYVPFYERIRLGVYAEDTFYSSSLMAPPSVSDVQCDILEGDDVIDAIEDDEAVDPIDDSSQLVDTIDCSGPFVSPQQCNISRVLREWDRTPLQLFELRPLEGEANTAVQQNCHGVETTVDFHQIYSETLLVPIPCPSSEVKQKRLSPWWQQQQKRNANNNTRLLWFVDRFAEMRKNKNALLTKRYKILEKMIRSNVSSMISDVATAAGKTYDIRPYGKRYSSLREMGNANTSTHQGININHDQIRNGLSSINGGTDGIDSGKLMEVMLQYKDDPLGKRLMMDIARHIEIDMDLVSGGAILEYKKDYYLNGVHYVLYYTSNYGRCELKTKRLGWEAGVHSKNNLYIMVRLDDCTYYPKCHNEECQTYYALCLANPTVDPRTHPGEFLQCRKQARGDVRHLPWPFWNRVNNFLEFQHALDEWERQQDLKESVVESSVSHVGIEEKEEEAGEEEEEEEEVVESQ